jgi:DNA-binding GntR family transcriptional regulator
LSGQPNLRLPGGPPAHYAHRVAKNDPAELEFSVDRGSPVPLYFQLAQQLEAAIERGKLAPGSLLGNEIDLAGRLGLSRPTVRQAIQSLVDKGLLVRRRGIGTQVVHSQVKRPLELSSLYDDLEAAGQRPATQVLRFESEEATAEVAAALGVAEGTEVRHVERLRLTHGEPMAYLRNHLPIDLLTAAGRGELETTGLYRLMRGAGVTLHSARQTVGARSATPEEAELMGEETGAPLLTMGRTTFDDTGRAVEYASHLYRASRYAFEFQLLVRP